MATVKEVERMYAKKSKVLTISAEATIAVAAKQMSEHGVGSLIVIDTRCRVRGILTERDVISKVVAEAADPASTHVVDAMTTDVVSCTMDTQVEEVKEIMGRYGIRHLPIIEDGIAKGMISSRDIMAQQLSAAGALARKQSMILSELERRHPGITRVETDSAGCVVL